MTKCCSVAISEDFLLAKDPILMVKFHLKLSMLDLEGDVLVDLSALGETEVGSGRSVTDFSGVRKKSD
jgi:hypothetical protein